MLAAIEKKEPEPKAAPIVDDADMPDLDNLPQAQIRDDTPEYSWTKEL